MSGDACEILYVVVRALRPRRVVETGVLYGASSAHILHDSLHTYEHMTREFATVLPALSADGVLSSHDVRVAHSLRGVFGENAFPAFCRLERLHAHTLGNYGLACR